MNTYRKTIANKADALIADAQARQNKAEIQAVNQQGRAESMHDLAVECINLMRLLVTATDIQPAAGVYFLMNKAKQIIYVGQSQNVMCRMAGHKEKEFHTVRMIRIDRPNERDRIETRFIHLLKPPINLQYLGTDMAMEILHKNLESLAHEKFPPLGAVF